MCRFVGHMYMYYLTGIQSGRCLEIAQSKYSHLGFRSLIIIIISCYYYYDLFLNFEMAQPNVRCSF